jgi:hypothetical protein
VSKGPPLSERLAVVLHFRLRFGSFRVPVAGSKIFVSAVCC